MSVFARRFGVEQNSNVTKIRTGEFGGRNILYQARDVENLDSLLQRTVPKLMEIRSRRPRPHLDDKVLTSWNGLMISAFAKGAQVLDNPDYAKAASAARDFIRKYLWRESDATLLRRFREGEAVIEGFLDDYAFMLQGLLDLYETTFDPKGPSMGSATRRTSARSIRRF